MAISVAQSKQSTLTGSVTSRATTFDSSVTAGNSIIVLVFSRFAIATVTDNKGNTYVRDIVRSNSGSSMSFWRSPNVGTGGANFTVTATAGSLAGPIGVALVEVVGNLGFVIAGQGGPTVSNAPTIGYPVSSSDAYVVVAFHAGPTATVITSSPAGYSSRIKDTFTQTCQAMDRIYTAANPLETVIWALSAARVWISLAAVYSTSLAASFTGTPTSGAAPLTVDFTDSSTGTPTTWSWTFGDGQTSTAQNPQNIYAAAGSYTVSLTVTQGGSISSFTRSNYIVVDAGSPVGGAPTQPGIPNAPSVVFGPPIPGAPWMEQAMLPVPVVLPEAEEAEEAERVGVLVPVIPDALNQARIARQSQIVALLLNSLVRQKIAFRTGENAFAIRGRGFSETREPTVTDDVTAGAWYGTLWVYDQGDDEDERCFLCADPTQGAAEWLELKLEPTLAPVGGLTGTFPG